jgi:hypothetical protein
MEAVDPRGSAVLRLGRGGLADVNSYRLYGLSLRSELAFPELPRLEGLATPDVELSLRTLRPPRPAGAEGPHWFGSTGDESWFAWDDVASVRIAGGSTLAVDPVPGVDEAGLRSALLGPVFTILLAQRGLYPLHASSAVLDGAAVAFAGESGVGKSTLALALEARGHALFSDDVTAVRLEPEPITALPAFPQLKLLPDALVHRGELPESLPTVNPLEDKRARRLLGDFPAEGAPLARVYLLEDGEPEILGPMGSTEAFFEATRHGHRAPLLRLVAGDAGVMDRCARLVAGVPFYRLRRPRSLDRLSELVERIEEHVGSSR